jgi:hypothetical protein
MNSENPPQDTSAPPLPIAARPDADSVEPSLGKGWFSHGSLLVWTPSQGGTTAGNGMR